MENKPIEENMCILCKKEKAVGRTTRLYCKDCSKKDLFVKMAALQRDTRFKDGSAEYKKECWEREIVLKTDNELSKDLQEKCVSFSKEHVGFNEMIIEVKEFNNSIPGVIKAKIKLRKRTKVELAEMKVMILSLKKEFEEIEDKKGKKAEKKRKELKGDIKNLGKKKKVLEEELKILKRKK